MNALIFSLDYFVDQTVIAGYVSSDSQLIDRVYSQYRNSPKLIRWVNIVTTVLTKMNVTLQQIRTMLDIDSVNGERLNIIGRIVGIERSVVGSAKMSPPQFNSEKLYEFGDTSTVFSALTVDQDQNLSDEMYRLLIKSKIIKNNSDATIEGVIAAVQFILPDNTGFKVVDNEDMSYEIEYYGNLTPAQRYVFTKTNVLPKPQGVRFTGLLESVGYSQFGDVTAQFGNTDSQFVGVTQ